MLNEVLNACFRRNQHSNLRRFVFSLLNKQIHSSPRSNVELTSVRYPNLKRGKYASVTEKDVSEFERLLPGAARVITDPSELEGVNTDWIKNCRGISDTLLVLFSFLKKIAFCIKTMLCFVSYGYMST